MTNTPATPPGWYADPSGGAQPRWWDGHKWTEHVQQPYTAEELTAPAGTQVFNPWIWLVVFLPYLTLPLLFTIDFTSIVGDSLDYPTNSMAAQLSIFTSPGYILLTLGGLVISGLTVFFAYRDWKWLQAGGVPKPFHWAFAFFGVAGYPVYPIGRAIVTNRRTGKGLQVLWVVIGLIVLSFIIVIAWVAVLTSQMMALISTYPGLGN